MLALQRPIAGGDLGGDAEIADPRPLIIVPFESWHLQWLTVQTEQDWVALTPEYGMALQAAGPAFTAFAGMDVLACAGIIPIWQGRAQVWSLLSEAIHGSVHRRGIHKAVKSYIRDYRVRRLECTVDPRSARAVKWARTLGFHYEGTMTSYTPLGDTMDLYVRLE